MIIFLLEKFGKKDKLLRGIVGKLKPRSPRDQPLLLEWQTLSALPVLDSAKGQRARERKASRPRQDIVKVSKGEGLIVKKRRLAMSCHNESLAYQPMARVL